MFVTPKYEEGKLNIGTMKVGVTYKGTFYQFGTNEYNNLLLIEGKKEENKNTLLGIISETEF